MSTTYTIYIGQCSEHGVYTNDTPGCPKCSGKHDGGLIFTASTNYVTPGQWPYNTESDYDYFTRLAEEEPNRYAIAKQGIIERSRFYEAPKEEKPYEYDPDFDDPA